MELQAQNPEDYDDRSNRNKAKRQRRLNTDIEASIPVYELTTDSSIQDDTSTVVTNDILTGTDVALDDAGIKVYTLDNSNNLQENNLSIGDGFGYYFSATDFEGNVQALETDNELSTTYFIPPNLRHNVLKLLSLDPDITLTVSSLGFGHEFDFSGYNPSADVGVMYFALDLSTVGDGTYSDSLVNSVTGVYRLMSSGEAIDHSKNHGLNITRVNLDFRDPFIHYARDSQTLHLEQKDITFRSFFLNRDMAEGGILSRNIPFALIITPGCGSKHNPFDGQSYITNHGDPVVIRNIIVTPDTNATTFDATKTYMDEDNIYASQNSYYHGIYEKQNDQDPQGIMYKFNPSSTIFTNNYFIDGKYTTEQPASSLRQGSYESQLVVGVVDKLLDLYNIENYLTWWDVYRRLNINQIGGLYFTPNTNLINLLSNGWRGVPVIDVLSRVDKKISGIEENLVAEDKPIINEEDRNNAKNYQK